MEAGLHIRPVYNVNFTGYSLIQRLTEAQEPGYPGLDDPALRRLIDATDLTGQHSANGGESLGWREHNVEDDEGLDAQDRSGLTPGADDARVVVDFTVGPSGVGPVMGLDSGDFFPSAPDADIDRNPTD
jgi:hypothetical protein